MDKRIKQGLDQDLIIDITTIGRKSGARRRIEIWFFNIDGRIFITGTPGTRGWYANVIANPEITFHLKQSIEADITASCRPITDIKERRLTLLSIFDKLDGKRDINEWALNSPLIEVYLNTNSANIY